MRGWQRKVTPHLGRFPAMIFYVTTTASMHTQATETHTNTTKTCIHKAATRPGTEGGRGGCCGFFFQTKCLLFPLTLPPTHTHTHTARRQASSMATTSPSSATAPLEFSSPPPRRIKRVSSRSLPPSLPPCFRPLTPPSLPPSSLPSVPPLLGDRSRVPGPHHIFHRRELDQAGVGEVHYAARCTLNGKEGWRDGGIEGERQGGRAGRKMKVGRDGQC